MYNRIKMLFNHPVCTYPMRGLRALLLMSTVFMAACESKWEKMPDDVLAAKASDCLYMTDPGTAMIQVCKNYKRECERRRSLGKYIC